MRAGRRRDGSSDHRLRRRPGRLRRDGDGPAVLGGAGGVVVARRAGGANGPACTPGSVRGPVDKLRPRGRSSLSATRCRAAPAAYPGTRRAASSSPVWPCSGRGLPRGSCHHDPGGLLHHPFTLPRTLRAEAVCSLWHCLADCSGWALPTVLPCGARTFLGTGEPVTRPSSRPIRTVESTRAGQPFSAVSPIRRSRGKSMGNVPNSSRPADAADSRTAAATRRRARGGCARRSRRGGRTPGAATARTSDPRRTPRERHPPGGRRRDARAGRRATPGPIRRPCPARRSCV